MVALFCISTFLNYALVGQKSKGHIKDLLNCKTLKGRKCFREKLPRKTWISWNAVMIYVVQLVSIRITVMKFNLITAMKFNSKDEFLALLILPKLTQKKFPSQYLFYNDGSLL